MNASKNITVKNIRNANITKVMYSLLEDKVKTRNVLAKENHISLMTIKHIVDDLVQRNIVMETVCNDTEVGRKPKVLEINNVYGNIVCINLTSKSKIKFLIYNIYEQLVDKGCIRINKNKMNYKESLCNALNEIKTRLHSIPSQTVGIAAFVPSAYYEDLDLINYDLIADFKDLHIKSLLKEYFNLGNIIVVHDVYSAAKSEYDSLNPVTDSLFYFFCGSGIGGLFIHNDIPVMGKNLMAGEIGKMLVPKDRNSDEDVILEEIASVDAILDKLKQQGITEDFVQVIDMYNDGDKLVEQVINPTLKMIARVLYNLLWVYNPDYIVIDSSYKEYSSLITRYVKEFFVNMRNEAIPIDVEISEAKYNEPQTMRGCFHMALSEWIKNIAEAGGK